MSGLSHIRTFYLASSIIFQLKLISLREKCSCFNRCTWLQSSSFIKYHQYPGLTEQSRSWSCIFIHSSTSFSITYFLPSRFYSLLPIKPSFLGITLEPHLSVRAKYSHFTSLLTAPHYKRQKCLNGLSMNECGVTRLGSAAVHCLLSLTK